MKRPKFTILVAAENANDQSFIRRAIEATNVHAQVRLVSCGEEAIAYLKGKKQFADRAEYQYPSFLLTDLKMSPGDGFSILNYLKSNPESAIIPTVVLSGSKEVNDIKQAYALGASAYLVKPAQPDEFARLVHLLVAFWMVCEVPQVDEAGHRV
jgi:two-component system response regulator